MIKLQVAILKNFKDPFIVEKEKTVKETGTEVAKTLGRHYCLYSDLCSLRPGAEGKFWESPPPRKDFAVKRPWTTLQRNSHTEIFRKAVLFPTCCDTNHSFDTSNNNLCPNTLTFCVCKVTWTDCHCTLSHKKIRTEHQHGLWGFHVLSNIRTHIGKNSSSVLSILRTNIFPFTLQLDARADAVALLIRFHHWKLTQY